MKASFRSISFRKELEDRRNRRALNRRIKPAFRRLCRLTWRCDCVYCVPWYVDEDFGGPRHPRAFHLRHHALYLMEELAALSPRVVGALAEPDEGLPYFDGIELEVRDLSAARRHLEALGYRTERVRRGARVGLEAEGIEPLTVWPASPAEGLDPSALEAMMEDVYGPHWRTATRLRRK